MDTALAVENLRAAYLKVKANGGAPGVDGVTVEELKTQIEGEWEIIAAKLQAGKYRPAAVRAVEIPKPNGGKRQLGIPTMMDRMIQQALLQAMGPYL